MMFDDVFYDDGGTSSSGSCAVISVIDCVMGNAQIAFQGCSKMDYKTIILCFLECVCTFSS
jgi:hypothetical protein